MLYELYKEAQFETDDLVLKREVFDEHVKRHYLDWMWHLREHCVKTKFLKMNGTSIPMMM